MPPPLEKISRYIPAIGKAISRGFYDPGSAQNLPPLSSLAQGSYTPSSPEFDLPELPPYTVKTDRNWDLTKDRTSYQGAEFSRPEFNVLDPKPYFSEHELRVFDTIVSSGGVPSEAARRLNMKTGGIQAKKNHPRYNLYREHIDPRPYPMLISQEQDRLFRALVETGGSVADTLTRTGLPRPTVSGYIVSDQESSGPKTFNRWLDLQDPVIADKYRRERQENIETSGGPYGQKLTIRNPSVVSARKLKKKTQQFYDSIIRHGGDIDKVRKDTGKDINHNTLNRLIETGLASNVKYDKARPVFHDFLETYPQEVQDRFWAKNKEIRTRYRKYQTGPSGLPASQETPLTYLREKGVWPRNTHPSIKERIRINPEVEDFMGDQLHLIHSAKNEKKPVSERKKIVNPKRSLDKKTKRVLNHLAENGTWPDSASLIRRSKLRHSDLAKEYMENIGGPLSLLKPLRSK